MHHLRCLGHQLADPDALGTRFDWLELAADVVGCVGLEIPDIDGRRAAGKPDHDDVARPSLCFGACLQAKQIGQPQTEQAGSTETEKVPAMETLAIDTDCSCHDGNLKVSHLASGVA